MYLHVCTNSNCHQTEGKEQESIQEIQTCRSRQINEPYNMVLSGLEQLSIKRAARLTTYVCS